MWKRGDNCQELLLSFYRVSSGDQTQTKGLAGHSHSIFYPMALLWLTSDFLSIKEIKLVNKVLLSDSNAQ